MMFNIILCGAREVGKTTYLNTLEYGYFNNEYVPTSGFECRRLTYITNFGEVSLNIFDISRDCDVKHMPDSYKKFIHGVFVMHDDSHKTQVVASKLIEGCRRIFPEILMIRLINKKKILTQMSSSVFNTNIDVDSYQVSVKYRWNVSEPIISMMKKLVSNKLEVI